MTAKRRRAVLWTQTARRDLERIALYIAQDDVPAALALVGSIEAKATRLAAFPLSGRVVPELKGLGLSSYRELIVAPWRVIYRIANARVLVLAVIDGRRNVEDVLLERLVDPD